VTKETCWKEYTGLPLAVTDSEGDIVAKETCSKQYTGLPLAVTDPALGYRSQ
jgi:hypothetical protein